MVFLIAFTYWPMLQVLIASLYARRTIGAEGAYVGAKSYARLVDDADLSGALINTGVFTARTEVPSIVLGYLFAVALRQSRALAGFCRAILFLPTLMLLVAASALFISLPTLELLDYCLAKLGARSVNWLGNPDLALASLILLTVWKNAGYFVLFFLEGLQSLPEKVVEPTLIEGASWWQRKWFVVMPMLGPTFAFVPVIGLINAVSRSPK
ncbi:MAG: sugar ABC transporter permease [Pseudomonadota bacterium]